MNWVKNIFKKDNSSESNDDISFIYKEIMSGFKLSTPNEYFVIAALIEMLKHTDNPMIGMNNLYKIRNPFYKGIGERCLGGLMSDETQTPLSKLIENYGLAIKKGAININDVIMFLEKKKLEKEKLIPNTAASENPLTNYGT
jgi:hypothetical protein